MSTSLRRVARIATISGAVLLTLTIVAIAGLRHVLANRIHNPSPNAIAEAGYVSIGGQQQWLEIRGSDPANPVLLWLHGGPGLPVLSATYAPLLPWERSFTIVHWHQRGAGLTRAAATEPAPLTIERMIEDGIEVAEHVRKRLRKDKIILLGHSWGALLGTRMAQRRPDLFAAYVGTGQFTNLERDGRDLFAAAMEKAKRESNDRAVAELAAVAALPPTDVQRMDAVRRWGRTEDVSDGALLAYLAPLLSPGYPARFAFSFVRGFQARGELYAEQLLVDLEADVPAIRVPAFLFQGRYDWQVSTPSALRYFERLQAPAKQVVLFDGGHLVPFLQSEAFLRALVAEVRPLAD